MNDIQNPLKLNIILSLVASILGNLAWWRISAHTSSIAIILELS